MLVVAAGGMLGVAFVGALSLGDMLAATQQTKKIAGGSASFVAYVVRGVGRERGVVVGGGVGGGGVGS